MKMNLIAWTSCLLGGVSMLFAGESWALHAIDDGVRDGKKRKGADGVRLLDVNGDGLMDIACGWEEAKETRAYLHPGHDKVAGKWPAVTVGQSGAVEDAVFCDLDGDGAFDVISCSESREIFIHWAPKDQARYLDPGAWETVPLPAAKGVQNWMISVPLQIDGKHGIDFVAAGKKAEVYFFEAPEDPRKMDEWEGHVISQDGGWTMGLQDHDMDGDGDRDILLGIRTTIPGVKWLENPGHGAAQFGKWWTRKVGFQGESM